MKVLVNALSVTNRSGRHVLLGHLQQITQWTRGQHEYQVLFHRNNRDICSDLGQNVHWVECPGFTAKWVGRAMWEMVRLPKLAARLKTDFLWAPSGTVIPNFPLPQVSFAQNPWSLVRDIYRSIPEELKAALQRQNYKATVGQAALVLYNSEYMRQIYRKNAGTVERASAVVYQALNEHTHTAARFARNTVKRKAWQILSVSVMAPHKGAETLVAAVDLLRKRDAIPARLIIAGSWPNTAYHRKIRKLIATLALDKAIEIKGHVNQQALHQLYSESRIFSLMSRCESFGIPAIEAQAFGTPVVSSNCCAIPEVCGHGGLYPEPGDIEGTVTRLRELLTDDKVWKSYSDKAVANAEKYHWAQCSKDMLCMFDWV